MTCLRIGVLGGIGPEATGQFYLKLITALQKSGCIGSNTDYPQIFINSIPAPELIGDKISEAELQDYISGIVELDKIGVDLIVMVCNTIHLYKDKLQAKVETPILDLREEVRKRLSGKVAILGTPSTVRLGLYTFPDVTYVCFDSAELTEIGQIVYQYNKGVDKEIQRSALTALACKKLDEGADCLVLACTELAVMLEHVNIPKVDTMAVLVEAVLQRILCVQAVS